MAVRDTATVCAVMAQIAPTVVPATATTATTLALTQVMVSAMMVVQDRCTVCAPLAVIALIAVLGMTWQLSNHRKVSWQKLVTREVPEFLLLLVLFSLLVLLLQFIVAAALIWTNRFLVKFSIMRM